MNPDMVVGTGLVAASVAGWGASLLANRWALSHHASLEPEQLRDRCDECGTSIETTCPHGRSLCVDCAPGSCDECLTDARCQGVLSQYVIGTFPTSGGAA